MLWKTRLARQTDTHRHERMLLELLLAALGSVCAARDTALSACETFLQK